MGDDTDVNPLERPIPTPPGMLRVALIVRDVRTVGDLLAIDPEAFALEPKVGGRRVAALRAFQAAVAHWAQIAPRDPEAYPPPPPPPIVVLPDDLPGLLEWMDAQLDDRTRDVFELRFDQMRSLHEVGKAFHLTRERIRQILKRALERMQPVAGEAAIRMLDAAAPEWRHGLIDAAACGISAGRASSVAQLVTGKTWTVYGGLVYEDAKQFEHARRTLKVALRGRQFLAPEEVRACAEELGVPTSLVSIVLVHEQGWTSSSNGGLERPAPAITHRQRIVEALRVHGKPAPLDDLAAWFDPADGTPLKRRKHRIESLLSREPAAVRCGQGTFVHVDHLGAVAGGLDPLIDWCVAHITGTPNMWSVEVLLERAAAAGHAVGDVDPTLAKWLMQERPGVLGLRKNHVGWAETYAEHGVDLADRIVAFLDEASKPLTVDEVIALFPPEIRYSRLSFLGALRHDPRFTKKGNGWTLDW